MKNAYEAEVRRIAEILARIQFPYSWAYYDLHELRYMQHERDKDLSQVDAQARSMVAEMNTVHYKGYVSGLSAKDQWPGDDESSIDMRNEYYESKLIERGLIPSPENENI